MRPVPPAALVVLALAGPAAAAPPAGADPTAAGTSGLEAPRPFSRGEFQAFAHARSGEVRDCYEEGLKGAPALQGRIDLRFELLETGALDAVHVARSTLGAPAVEACIVEALRRWRTPFRPPAPISLEYPFVFRPVPPAAPGP